ncbi:hypothetical protein SUGI_1179400 [Cryptomeria japonica]|nr:hypothetical protein SUGI_1179400 [Cryptomeria japonica]
MEGFSIQHFYRAVDALASHTIDQIEDAIIVDDSSVVSSQPARITQVGMGKTTIVKESYNDNGQTNLMRKIHATMVGPDSSDTAFQIHIYSLQFKDTYNNILSI